MARLFLHIGAHKTATSYLQALFDQNRALLQDHGIHYPPTHPYQAHHQFARYWMKTPTPDPAQHLSRSPEDLWADLLQDHITKGPGTVFLSSEMFSHFTPPRIDMARLAERLSAFEEVRVIYTVRAQPDLLNSAWIERVKKRASVLPRKFVEQSLETRRAFGAALDHNAFYHHLLTGFDPGQIILFHYDDIRHRPGGIAQSFLDILGLPLKVSDLQQAPVSTHNVSPDALSLWFAVQIHRDGPPPAELIERVAAILHGDRPRRSTILSQREYRKISSRFHEGNARLVETVAPWQPEFRFDPPPPPGDLLHRDQIPPHIWPDIAAALWADRAQGNLRGLLGRAINRVLDTGQDRG
ncbi:MAG: hypothetical protein ACK4GW_12830 [Pseudorhodobacter sp.]